MMNEYAKVTSDVSQQAVNDKLSREADCIEDYAPRLFEKLINIATRYRIVV